MLDSTRRPRPELEPTDINSLLTQILDATQPTLMARSVELQANILDDLPQVLADPDQLQQVFINLINNSLDAMPGGGTLTVNTKLLGDRVEIELSDTGGGITADKLDMIFDPFFSTKHRQGTGLGLTIVEQIIYEHNGDIQVESEPGRMTRFIISLPAIPGLQKRESASASATEPEADNRVPVLATTTIPE